MATTRAAAAAKGKAKMEYEGASTPTAPIQEDSRVTSTPTMGISFMPHTTFVPPTSLPFPSTQYAYAPMPSFPSFPAPSLPSSFSLHPSSTSPIIPMQAQSFPPNLTLPSLSKDQKLTPNNYLTWIIFMQLLLQNASVWQVVVNPSLVHPQYQG